MWCQVALLSQKTERAALVAHWRNTERPVGENDRLGDYSHEGANSSAREFQAPSND
jgi:hypothetical protein